MQLDPFQMKTLGMMELSKDEFVADFGDEHLDIYLALKNSKMGWIEVEKISKNGGYYETGAQHMGFTLAFAEGIGCYMTHGDRWFTTSIILKIDWDKGEFTTLNSVYKFRFETIDEMSELLNASKQRG